MVQRVVMNFNEIICAIRAKEAIKSDQSLAIYICALDRELVRVPPRTRSLRKEDPSSEIVLTGTKISVVTGAVNRPGAMLFTRIPYSAI